MKISVNENNDFGHRLVALLIEQQRRANNTSKSYRHENDGDFLRSEQVIKKMEVKNGK